MTVPPVGMARSVQIWKGLFAVVQVTVCPGAGIGGWLQAARSGLGTKTIPSVIASPNACRNRERLALPAYLQKLFPICVVSGFQGGKEDSAEQIGRLRLSLRIVFIRLGYLGCWQVIGLLSACSPAVAKVAPFLVLSTFATHAK